MSVKSKIFFASLGLMFAALVIWVVQTTPDAPPPAEKIEPPKVMEYEGNTLSEEVNGVKIWDLTAKKMRVDIETKNAELTDLVGHFYQSDGSSIELRAKRGIYEDSTKNVQVEGDVVVTTNDGAKLTSKKLNWQNNEGILTALDTVKITKDDIVATGDKAESKDGFKHFWLKGRAHIIKGVQTPQ